MEEILDAERRMRVSTVVVAVFVLAAVATLAYVRTRELEHLGEHARTTIAPGHIRLGAPRGTISMAADLGGGAAALDGRVGGVDMGAGELTDGFGMRVSVWAGWAVVAREVFPSNHTVAYVTEDHGAFKLEWRSEKTSRLFLGSTVASRSSTPLFAGEDVP